VGAVNEGTVEIEAIEAAIATDTADVTVNHVSSFVDVEPLLLKVNS
jgi:hypothetical protein